MTLVKQTQAALTNKSALRVPALNRAVVIMMVLLGVIGAGAVSRFYRVNDPLVGIRQADTAAVARNFYEGAANIFYPQVDWGGSSPGYVEAEFQFYTYAVALLYRVFGAQDWLGRALNIGVYALSAGLLYQFARRLFNERVGVLAAFFYSVVPLSYIFTRTFQPDALMALGSLAAVYYFWRWSEERRVSALVLSALSLSVAVLIKPTSFYLGLPLLYLSYRAFGDKVWRQPILWGYAAFVFGATLLWYMHAVSLWQLYGNTFGIFNGWVKVGLPNRGTILPLTQRLWDRLLMEIATPFGLPLLLTGLFVTSRRRNYVCVWWAVGFGISVLLTALGHYEHNYYQLPFVFVAAVWMGAGADWLLQQRRFLPTLSRAAVAAACVLIVLYLGWQLTMGDLRSWTQVSDSEWERVAFAQRVAALTEPNAPLIFVRSFRGNPLLYQHRTAEGEFLECDPVDFYRSHRKGWSLDERQATPAFVETLRGRGAQYIATAFPEVFASNPALKAALDHNYQALEVTPRWAIYKLAPKAAVALTAP